ncbi:MAG: hypothetical protein Q4P20_07105 [Eubacteriales bacterium]|nr:hypothetical protein [Eubacteriales bacterium]
MRFGIFNIWQAIIVVIMLTPQIKYFLKHPHEVNQCTNRIMNILEQIGRYGCILFMVLPLGVRHGSFGFPSPEAFVVYLLGLPILLAVYMGLWEVAFEEEMGKLLVTFFWISVGLAAVGVGVAVAEIRVVPVFYPDEVIWPIVFILLIVVAGMGLSKWFMPPPGRKMKMAMAIIPALIFLLCGITLVHPLLIVSAVLFGIAHTYVTWQNVK